MNDREVTMKAYNALHFNLSVIEDYGTKEQLEVQHNAINALDHALAQEQTKCPRCGEVNPAEIHTCSPQIAQGEQEPVAWLVSDAQGRYATIRDPAPYGEEVYEPLYAAPPKRKWVGLTDEERRHFNNRLSGSGVAEEIEAKLKEKNT